MKRTKSSNRIALAIHGGAGTIARADMRPQQARRYREALTKALNTGWKVLRDGGTSLDAVCGAVVVMENSAIFNAGRGAVLNAASKHELDASIMDGATLKAGAVAVIQHAKNPVLVARTVMEKTPHVLLAGPGADRYARTQGFTKMPASYFYTKQRGIALQRARAQQRMSEAERHGTVGAVALDHDGNLSAATSTGGYTNKMVGRVGDSATIGAGTYADNASCAVSATGDGEIFIRATVAHDIAARMRYGGQTLRQAANATLRTVQGLGATGGVIAVNRRGTIAIAFNSEAMYRGYVSWDRRLTVAIY